MKKLLYINKQYREYDKQKYKVLSEKFALTVIWLCPFRKTERLPEDLWDKMRYFILGFEGNRLKPWHLYYNVRLLKLLFRYGKNTDIIISSTSDSWQSKIAFFVAKCLINVPVSFRKEVWFKDRDNSTLLANINNEITRFIEKRADGLFYPGAKQRLFLLERGVAVNRLFPFPCLILDMKLYKDEHFKDSVLLKKIGNKFVFLFLGRIIELKGLDILIKAFSKLESRYKQAFLLIVGEPVDGGYYAQHSLNYYENCKKLIDRCSVRNINFLGYVKPQNIWYYYKISDVFVQPNKKYLKNVLTGEGWGNVVVEAASMGLPLIVSDRVSSGYELVENGKNGFLIDSDSLEENLYNAMQYMIENADQLKEFGKYSRLKYEAYNDPGKIVNSIKSVID